MMVLFCGNVVFTGKHGDVLPGAGLLRSSALNERAAMADARVYVPLRAQWSESVPAKEEYHHAWNDKTPAKHTTYTQKIPSPNCTNSANFSHKMCNSLCQEALR